MRIPHAVLCRVRGPALAVAVLGCSSAPATPIEPVPAPEPELAAVIAPAAVDPVDYDLDSETERLEQADRVLAAAETRRARRIEAEEEEEAVRRRRRDRALETIGVGHATGPNQWILAACGRG